MTALTDEQLMAYADGELDAAERERVAAMVAREPGARSRLQIFTSTRDSTAELRRVAVSEPLPPHLVDLVMARARVGAQSRRAASLGWRGTGEALANLLRRNLSGWQVATACTAALLLGVIGGRQLAPGVPIPVTTASGVSLDDGHLVAQGGFREALETAPSGSKATVAAGGAPVMTVEPVLTFKRVGGGYCREYTLSLQAGEHFSGIACRSDGAKWRLQAHAPSAARKEGGTRAAARPVDALAERLRDGDTFGADEEREVLSKRWRP